MIIITEVKTITVDRDPYEIWRFGPKSLDEQTIYIDKELVHGRRFCRPTDGVDIIVGATLECQDILGLQYEAWDEMEQITDHWKARTKDLQKEVTQLKSLSFWGKIKWAFKSLRE